MLARSTICSSMRGVLNAGIAATVWLTAWLHTSLSPHDGTRLAEIALSAFAALYLVARSAFEPRYHIVWSPRDNLLPGSLLSLVLASWLTAAHQAVSFQDIALHLGLFALAFAVAQADSSAHCWFDRALAATPVWLAGLITFIYVAALSTGQPLNARQLHLAFDNPRFLNHAQTVFVPWLTIVFAGRESHKNLRRLALVAASFHVGLAYLDVARGTYMSWFAALAFLVFAGAREDARRFATVLVGGLLFGLLAFDFLPSLLSRHWDVPFARASEIGYAHSRDTLWAHALAMIKTSPWLGVGPMEFAAITSAQAAHPHNIYLQWAAEYGLPAAALATMLLAKPIVNALRMKPQETRAIGLAAVCCACLVDGCVSGNFVMPASQLWIACLYGQLLACGTPSQARAPACWDIAAAAALLASQVWLLSVALNQSLLSEPYVPYPDRAHLMSSTPKPRFWLNGQL